MNKFFISALVSLAPMFSISQGLENIIVETYYISDANDAVPNDGGTLNEGSTTYRIYVDMAPDYELQAVYGNENHEVRIETSTFFFNNEDRGETLGGGIGHSFIDDNTVAVDSWLAMSGATTLRLGILKADDPDGSIVGGVYNNDGLLNNEDPLAGIPLEVADGLMTGTVPSVTVVGLNLSMFDMMNSPLVFSSNNGAWSVLAGVQGPTADNRVLVAQITTDGDLTFCLNIQLGTPDGDVEQYVSSNPVGDEQFFEALCFPVVSSGLGCTSLSACNYDATATEDDGTCIEPIAACQACNANNDGLDIIDEDNDGICDAEEVLGCTLATACNYNPDATDDDATCIEPIPNCLACNANNDGLVIIDTDGDGTCDAQENPGCTSATACNYDAAATGDDGTCIEPQTGCSQCNDTNNGLEIIDTDGDGVCNAEEIFGCTSDMACNYDPAATEENGDCIIPVFNCQECNDTNDGLLLVDDDSDGVCNANEISGCTSSSACNYDPLTTDDDDSCIEPIENCWACNGNNDGLVIIDTDNDGVCDAEESLGCTSSTACNYDENALNDDGSCIEPVADCWACNTNNDGLELVDDDSDGICNAEEIPGCTDPDALNYDPLATDDDGSCEYFTGVGCDETGGLEDVIVEIYYVCDATDTEDEDGGSDLALDSYTYRIYADLVEGYELQAVFGNAEHELRFETTTYFYNQNDRGVATGDAIPHDRLDENTLALDSWVAMGAASDIAFAVLKSEDTDGSIVGGANNDGGSEGIAAGLLINDHCLVDPLLTEADGLVLGPVPQVTAVGLDLTMFDNENNGPVFTSNNGAWSVLEGVQGPTAENKVLIAQITTDGDFSFELNLQLGTPLGDVVQYVASAPTGEQVQCDKLIYGEIFGCTNDASSNFNPAATIDDCSCTTGVNELDALSQFIDVFPNPTDGMVAVTFDFGSSVDASYVVYNVWGEEILSADLHSIAGSHTEVIDISAMAHGVYSIRFMVDGNAVTKRVVKE
ncbi:MAG: T9SS type A sorting domain-containing protein [Flavobacteriales bacterium]|nr:T9SS type A sorting domain-containing protein [Flavobacteriales bacterium]